MSTFSVLTRAWASMFTVLHRRGRPHPTAALLLLFVVCLHRDVPTGAVSRSSTIVRVSHRGCVSFLV